MSKPLPQLTAEAVVQAALGAFYRAAVQFDRLSEPERAPRLLTAYTLAAFVERLHQAEIEAKVARPGSQPCCVVSNAAGYATLRVPPSGFLRPGCPELPPPATDCKASPGAALRPGVFA
jgi:hypothetical protein